uniref:Vacuolar protein sorting 13 homolog A n=1 Tax=Loxodonta africana TaxID=9785 RepID=G3T225_LOXAF
GAVSLKNLKIKENALHELDVPFKVKAGHIGNLSLVIPWKNLYTQPVEAVLEEIYLLIVPSSIIKYDPLKEEKQILEAKQQELKRIEEAKQKVADQGKIEPPTTYGITNHLLSLGIVNKKRKKSKRHYVNIYRKGMFAIVEQPKEEKQDTFIEKLVTQIIKNLQVKISSIHIRYEDDITNRDNPLSFGISLQNLSLQTTDQDWVPCLHNESEKLFRKLVRLDNLFAYWNVKSEMFYHYDYDESLNSLKNGIVNENIVPEGYDFVFRPISANAKLQMNRRSDFDFSDPKINLDVELHDIAIELNKPQYFSLMELLESVDMMKQNLPYRKFKPDVPLHYHAREWWAYAINGVLEVNIRPSLRMWSWKHIRDHRQKVKQYKELYKKKLTTKKLAGDILLPLEQELEKILDVFNLTLTRQQAEVEVKKAGYKIYKEGAKDSEENKGWLDWLWSWSEASCKEQPDVKPGTLEEMLTPDEKAKLYEAIGYSETAVDPTLPKTFEAMKFFLHLKSMSIVLRENHQKPELLEILIEEFSTLVVQRPGAQAIKFETKIDSFHITGLPDNFTKPRLLSSLDDATSLFQITFEINPIDETVAQRCIIEAEPLEMIYDARTVNSIVEFFRPPQDVHLTQLTSATLMKLEEFRDKTATGLLYIIETQKVLDLRINLKASYIIVPQDGIFSPASNLLLLDLGHLKVTSKNRSELPDVKPGEASLEEIMRRAYDTFDIQLTSIQLLYSRAGDNWKEARKLNVSTQHILIPMQFNVELSKAMVVTDLRMPKYSMYCLFHVIVDFLSNFVTKEVLYFIDCLPLPDSSQSPRHWIIVLPCLSPANTQTQATDLFKDISKHSSDNSQTAPGEQQENAQRVVLKASCLVKCRRKKEREVGAAWPFPIRFLLLLPCGRERPWKALKIHSGRNNGLEHTSNHSDISCKASQPVMIKSKDEVTGTRKKELTYVASVADKPKIGSEKISYSNRTDPEFSYIFRKITSVVNVSFQNLNLHLMYLTLLNQLRFVAFKINKNNRLFKNHILKKEIDDMIISENSKQMYKMMVTLLTSASVVYIKCLWHILNAKLCLTVLEGQSTILLRALEISFSKLTFEAQGSQLVTNILVSLVFSGLCCKEGLPEVPVYSTILALPPGSIIGYTYCSSSSLRSMTRRSTGCFQVTAWHVFVCSISQNSRKRVFVLIGSELLFFQIQGPTTFGTSQISQKMFPVLELPPIIEDGKMKPFKEMLKNRDFLMLWRRFSSVCDDWARKGVDTACEVIYPKFSLRLLAIYSFTTGLNAFQFSVLFAVLCTKYISRNLGACPLLLILQSLELSPVILKTAFYNFTYIFLSSRILSVQRNLDSEEEFFDAPCSPLEEPLQLPTTAKCSRHRQFQKQDYSKNMTECKIRFEVPEVLIQFYHLVGDCELPVVEFDVLGLGTQIEFRTYDLKANAFLKEFCLKCPEYLDEDKKPVYVITTLDNTMEDLLTLEYVKAEKNVSDLKSTYNNVVQLLKVNFSSLDIHLHTEALLNTMNYFNNILPQSEEKSAPVHIVENEDKGDVIKKLSSKLSKDEDIITLQILAELSCLRIFIQDQKRKISEIKIEGLDSEIIMRPKVTEINAKLRNIIVLDSDVMAVYKKAVYITGKEVFSFKMISYMDATAGSAYTDMNVADIQVNLTVGCIEVVFVTKFLYSILAFIDNFQAAKQALTEATVQAAGMAATGVKELAQRSSRMALDVNIKAPVVVIPQSPVSENVFVADFGLITMTNTFHMIAESQSNPPPVIDLITVKLSEMRLYRSQYINDAYQEVLDILLPLNLEVVIERNLSWEWYQEVPGFNINAQLKPMEFILSQEDITTVFKTLYGNICLVLSKATPTQFARAARRTRKRSRMNFELLEFNDIKRPKPGVNVKTTLNISFKTDYLTMVLYSPSPDQTSFRDVRDPSLQLAEFRLENIISTLKMYTDDSTFSSFSLKNCILDDKRPHVKKATPRMIGLTVGFDKKDMMDVRYKRVRDGWVSDLVFQEMYICASVEFLMTVANVFLEAYSTGTAVETSVQAWSSKEEVPVAEPEKWEINVMIKNPEFVFVADMTRNDAPALVITTQCEICWKGDLENETMTAAIKDFQVRACPFLPVKRKGNVTTVLQPCDLFYQATRIGTDPQVIDMSVKSLTLKVSPVIINTVITITSALYATKETTLKEATSSAAQLWEKKDTKNLKMWFLEEPNEAENTAPTTELVPKGEMIKINIDSIFIVLEAGIGHRTVPMLLAKSRFSGEGKNWSSLINLHCQLELEVHYYNEMFGVWEPLLQNLEWQYHLKHELYFNHNKMNSKSLNPKKSKVPEYKTIFNFYSKDQLNITLSKCGLVMLNNLGKAFTEAATGSSDVFLKDLAPFMIINSLGLTISVSPSDSFSVLNVPMAKSYTLKNKESLSMDYTGTKDNDHFSAMTSLSSKLFFILLTPVNHSTADKIPLTKVGRRLYTVRHRESGVERSIVCQIDAVEGSKKVTVRSPVQIRNHFSVPLFIYEGDTLLGTASPENEFNIPLSSYRFLCLWIKKVNGILPMLRYRSTYIISLKNIKFSSLSVKRLKKCRPTNPSKKPFIVNIVPEKDNLTFLSVYSEDGWDLPYIIHLWPPILLRNLLPYKIAYYIEGTEHRIFTLNEGCSAQIYTAELDKAKLHLKLLDYLNHDWKSEYHIKPNQQDIGFINFTCVTEIEKTDLDIAIHVTYNTGQVVVAFHSPYWMVNKTGRMLQYKADGIHRKHPPNYTKPVLFSFQPKHFFNDNKVQLMVTDSELSDQFSIDTVGSHGAVKCKALNMEYQVGVTIDLSSFNITRIVTFTPFYMIKNKSKYCVSVAEEASIAVIPLVKWFISCASKQCIPFWPEDASNKLLIQVEGSQGPPKKIYFNRQENCILLRLDNELGGIIAEVHLAEHSTIITFSDYHDGAATFLLINHTKDDLVQYKQSSLSQIEDSLPPGKAVFYTWADPVGSRKLKWKCGKSHGEVTQKDDVKVICKHFPHDANFHVDWDEVSFFEGLQRIILFTEDPRVFKVTYESEKAEIAEQEIVLSLQDVGISLVNNYTKQEVAYIGITSSDVVWETKPKKKARWKPMSVKQTEKLEKEFKEYTESSPSEDKIIELDTNIPVRLTPSGSNMKILQPHVIAVRRNYLPALKVEYSTSAHQSSFRIQIYRIQIQNQIHGAIFPFVFYPIRPPKSVTMDSAPKPFTDVSIVMRSAGHSQISRIKYFKVLIQEMDLRLDLGFVYALAELMTEAEVTEKTELQVELFHKDIEAFQEEYKTTSLVDTSQVSLYEYFHISPIKLHLSVSLSSGREEAKDSKQDGGLIPVHSLNLLLKSIGATLTDIQDVVFKLAFFELNYQFHTTPELQSEVVRHYSKQAIKQMYVLILGLEVLGNPFGLIREFSEGVEAFFYEPYQGAIQGPEEFVEGMALGLKALVGGAVGGLAGAASRITSAMAKGVAAMTMDEDYQQKRREAMNKQPAGLREGITRGGKGLVSGFVSGITGIVTKPIKVGAQKEGAAGFFKGVGKGLVGMARPTGGIIDMASSTFQGIKRATETSDEVESLRPPRFFNEDGVIRPYRLRDGTGNQMLQ